MKDVYANDPEKQAELDALREQADALGLKYHHRAGIPRLKQLLKESRFMPGPAAETVQSDEQVAEQTRRLRPGIDFMTEEQFKQAFANDPRVNPNPAQESNRLIRCRVQCMNPNKREWPGEIISVGNAKIGTWKKYIPYNNTPYHIPKIILDHMKESKCVSFVTARDAGGNETKKPTLIREYAIEELPPLTQQELKELAQQQAMRDGKVEAVG